ncbi:hypothetical protein LPW36_04035 [Jinshanibacter sp. LJY008]|uniref:Uncharacterized protein n=1 Tax=Limnobaculum eriocheiris TaxID=2897391 RepID=A0A9X1MVC6_9GAMM|nr:hypothetical protein [Limnobaculum eriocheiris]MCD1125203.1 hypothetical protein [Limnobaculum eriocheiris]
MKLEKAFSLDMNKTMTATEADYYYPKGAIRSKFSFKCPDLYCDAQITCANLDRAKNKRKVDPYYRTVSDHSDTCSIAKDLQTQKGTRSTYDDDYSDADVYIENAFRLNLRPLSNTRPENDETDDDSGRTNSIRGRQQTTDASVKRKRQRRKTVSSLVASYLNGDNFEVQLPGAGSITLREMFIEIDEQQIGDFEDELRIYYGKAWINKSPNGNGFSVRFANVLRHDELITRPSFFISSKLIEQCDYQKFQQSALEALVTAKPVDIYILSAVGPYLHKSGEYINFGLGGLEYLEYREN